MSNCWSKHGIDFLTKTKRRKDYRKKTRLLVLALSRWIFFIIDNPLIERLQIVTQIWKWNQIQNIIIMAVA